MKPILTILCLALCGCGTIKTPRALVSIPGDCQRIAVTDTAQGVTVAIDGLRMTQLAKARWQGANGALQSGMLAPLLAR